MAAKQNVALLDWDNTLRKGFMLVDWSRYLRLHEVMDETSTGTIEQTFESHYNGEIDYAFAIIRSAQIYATGLCGVSVEATRRLAVSFIEQYQKLYEYAPVLIGRLRDNGVKPIVVSGSPDVVLAPYAINLDFDLALGLSLRADDTGTTWSKVIAVNGGTEQAKRNKVVDLMREYNVILAIGDSPADIPLLEAASFPLLLTGSSKETSSGISVPNLTLVSEHSVIPVVE